MTDPLLATGLILVGVAVGAYLAHRRGGADGPPYDRTARYTCDACPGETFTDYHDARVHAVTHDAISEQTVGDVISEL